MKLIDSNLILRFLLNDNIKQANSVQKLFESGEKVIVTDVVVAEVVWVLTSFYKLSKEEIVNKLSSLLSIDGIICNKKLLNQTVFIYKLYNNAFIDSYLAAYAINKKAKGIYSFDRGLDKIKSVKRFEP